ncbi:MAG TPA: glycosyltransferase [bacterium]|jgi:glycosyltransferase involved in cell wall biosynthesis|nr:glycosyltransferase [bacterium]
MDQNDRVRTLHILTSLNRRGAETFAVQLVDRLSRKRFDPAIWTIRPPEPGRFLVPQRTAVLSGSNGGAIHSLRNLLRVARDYNPHLMHCHGGRALKYAAMLKPFWRPQAYVYTKIGSIHPWLDHPLRRLFYGFLFEQVDAIVAVGDQVRAEVEQEFHPRRPRLITILTGRDLSPFRSLTPEGAAATRAGLGLDSSHLILMTVGSLSWEKDPLLLLRLFGDLAVRDPRLRLVFVGDGPLRQSLQEAIRAGGLEQRVQLLGVRSDVPALLGAADVFVLSSETEGLPGVLIEAGMAGLPSVAFGVGAVAEVLKDGRTGFVVSPRDEAGFSQRVRELVDDPARRRELGREAREFCFETFNIDRSVRRHESLFLDLLHAAKTPAEHPTERPAGHLEGAR